MTAKEKTYLRDLAKKQQEIANLPIMAEREHLWYLHNELKGKRPMVVMEEGTFMRDIFPPMLCESDDARNIEWRLHQAIVPHEYVDDDKVMPNTFDLDIGAYIKFLGLAPDKTYSEDGLGFHIEPVIETLEEDMSKLSPSTFSQNANVCKFGDMANEVIGDILPVRYVNNSSHWGFGLTMRLVEYMGMDNMFCSMITEPELFHKLMDMATNDLIRWLRWQEENDLVFLNNGNNYMGSGSFCFTRELPQEDFASKVRSIDTWGHLNSQESVGLSPQMFAEMLYPYYAKLAEQFGLVYWGCCEPVHDYWGSLQNLPNLRKISISSWCDEALMAERLQGGNVIYSRKPSPNYLGVHKEFDEDAFTAHIKKTAGLVKGFKAEVIFRDVYKLDGNPGKIIRAVEITKNIMEDVY